MKPTSAGGYQKLQVFRANSCYDPDYTGAGVQPYGWDNWTAFFNRYQVLASSITVYMTANMTTATNPSARVFIIPSENTALANSSPPDLSNYPYVKQMKFGPNCTRGVAAKFKHYATTKRICGRTRANDNDATAAINANPNIDWFWLIYTDTSEWSVETQIYMTVKIKYYTKMSEAVSQAAS